MSFYIPDGKGFKEVKENYGNNSINDMAKALGYNTNQAHTCIGYKNLNENITSVTVEVFTSHVIFVDAKHGILLTWHMVNDFLKEIDFPWEYGPSNAVEILKDGIEAKAFKSHFIATVLGVPEVQNGISFVPKLSLNLFFIDGLLVDVQSADGLTKYARLWKETNPDFFAMYERVAKKYWGDNLPSVINEINIQAEAWADVPDAGKNKFIPLHTTKFETINYAMLMVCHYGKEITLNDFLIINYGRYKRLGHSQNKFQLDRFNYEFSETGNLLNTSLSKKI